MKLWCRARIWTLKAFPWAVGGFAFVLALLIFHPFRPHECVNIYDWYGVLPREVLDQFEKETGIRVHYDVFDNNESLEAKLLASNSGYDVVFPTATPFGVRQMQLGIYQKLHKEWLPHLKNIEPILVEKMQLIDEHFDYLLPYYWGTTGLAFDEDRLEELLPGVAKEGYDLLFNVETLKKIGPYGVSLLQEAVDILPAFLGFMGKDWDSRSYDDLWEAVQKLEEISKHVRRFSSSRFIMDLVMGDICLAQSWSGEALKALEDAQAIGRKIRYIIPKEGADIWIDAVAIPVGAPNLRNAHRFVDFLLRSDISAKITNASKIATMVTDAKPYILPEILKNELIFPPEAVLKRLHMTAVFQGPEAEHYERVRTRVWAQIKMKRPMTRKMFQDIVHQQGTRVSSARRAA